MSDFLFNLAVVVAGIAAGGVASVAGFGIGSLLTPVFVTQVATQIAVAAVSILTLSGRRRDSGCCGDESTAASSCASD
jgi:hypothetical protein